MENNKSKQQNRITNKKDHSSGEGKHVKGFIPTTKNKFLRI